MKKDERWVTFTRESFATYEDWKCVCEEVGADPKDENATITIHFDANDVDIGDVGDIDI